MHARVIRATVPEGGMDKGMEGIQAITVPGVKQLPGNRGGYWFGMRDSGRVVATVFFESQEALDASRDAASRLREETMAANGAQLAGVDEYEVVADTGQKVSTKARFGRLTFVEGDPADADVNAENVRTNVVPAFTEMAGYAGGVWLTDRTSGKGLGITLWESKEAMQASAQRATEVRTSATEAGHQRIVGVEEGEIGARAETD